MKRRPAGWDEAATIEALGGTTPEVAEAAGITDRTVRRWRSDPAFGAEVHRLRDMTLGRVTGRMVTLTDNALTAAEELLEAQAESVRLGAARLILNVADEWHAMRNVESRLAELERRIEA